MVAEMGRRQWIRRAVGNTLARRSDRCQCGDTRRDHPFKKGINACTHCPCPTFRGRP